MVNFINLLLRFHASLLLTPVVEQKLFTWQESTDLRLMRGEIIMLIDFVVDDDAIEEASSMISFGFHWKRVITNKMRDFLF